MKKVVIILCSIIVALIVIIALLGYNSTKSVTGSQSNEDSKIVEESDYYDSYYLDRTQVDEKYEEIRNFLDADEASYTYEAVCENFFDGDKGVAIESGGTGNFTVAWGGNNEYFVIVEFKHHYAYDVNIAHPVGKNFNIFD